MLLAQLFNGLLLQLPLYLVWLAGIGLALIRRQRHPRASLLALIGIGMLLASSVLSTIVSFGLPLLYEAGAVRGGVAMLANLLGVCRIVFSVIEAIGCGLLLAAAFSGRALQPVPEKASEL